VIRRPGAPYHALLHALKIVRFIAGACEGFSFLPGKYEAGSEKPAIELLAGDPAILDYLAGKGPDSAELAEYFHKEEEKWIDATREYRFYDEDRYPAA
jgi:hypothetical protein